MSDSLRAKLLRTDLEAWNHPRYVYLGAPVFAALGVIIGQLWGVHLVPSPLGEGLSVGLFAGATVIAGLAVLALVD